MNRRTLAICDPEEAYACRLMDALSRREDFPFEVLAFTGAERLQDSLARKPVQILLIAQGLFREEMKDWVRHVILLQEEENSPVQELPCVSKYSSVLRIAKKVTETAMQTEKLPFLQTVGKACVYGFYTPVGRSLQTTLALTMGQLLAANKRVLYLNFECCAGLTEMLGKQADNTEFASLLYYLQESKEQFLGRLYQAAEWISFFRRHAGTICTESPERNGGVCWIYWMTGNMTSFYWIYRMGCRDYLMSCGVVRGFTRSYGRTALPPRSLRSIGRRWNGRIIRTSGSARKS